MRNSTETVPSWTSNNDEEEITLKKWRKLYNEAVILADSIMWREPGGQRSHGMAVLLWDLTKLIARLEQGMK